MLHVHLTASFCTETGVMHKCTAGLAPLTYIYPQDSRVTTIHMLISRLGYRSRAQPTSLMVIRKAMTGQYGPVHMYLGMPVDMHLYQ